MHVIVCRHAEDLGPPHPNYERSLTAKGKIQATELASKLSQYSPTHIISSSMRRAIQTAEILHETLGGKMSITDLLDEQRPGITEEISDELRNNRGYVQLDDTYNGGETYGSLMDRLKKFVAEYLIFNSSTVDDDCIVVTHGRTMTVLLSILMGYEPNGFNLALDYTSYYIIEFTEDWRPMLKL